MSVPTRESDPENCKRNSDSLLAELISSSARNNGQEEAEGSKCADGAKKVVPTSAYAKRKQLLATVIVGMSCFINGVIMGFTGATSPSLTDSENGQSLLGTPLSVTLQDLSWLAGVLNLGGLVGCLCAAPIMEKIGRRQTLTLFSTPLFFFGYALIIFAENKYMLIAGRTLNGIGIGFSSVAASVYLVETTSADMRGVMGALQAVLLTLGIIFSYLVGALLQDWKYLAITNIVWCVPSFLGLVLVVPETPHFLLTKGREYSAARSLEWLYGQDDDIIDRELAQIKRDMSCKKSESQQNSPLAILQEAWHPILVTQCLVLFYSFNGNNVLLYYTTIVLDQSGSAVSSDLAFSLLSAVGLVSLFAALVAVVRFRRKSLLLLSPLTMALSLSALVVCMLDHERGREPVAGGWVPLLAISVYNSMGTVGVNGLVAMVTAELLPARARAAGQSLAMCMIMIWRFISTKVFVDLAEAVNYSGSFVIYAGVCFVTWLFVLLLVPETRNRRVEEIQRDFERGWLQLKLSVPCKKGGAR